MMRREEGVVIVAVLWICALIMWFALQIAAETRMLGEEQVHLLRKSQALHLAIGGCYEALGRMGQPLGTGIDEPQDGSWQPNGEPHLVDYETGRAIVIIESENRKVNVNIAQHDPLKAALERSGLDSDFAEGLADMIADFIDPDDIPRLHGAEKEYYEESGRRYIPFNGALTSLDQLLLLPGISPQLFYGYGQPSEELENPDAVPIDPAIPGKNSLFRLLTVYGENQALPEEDEIAGEFERSNRFRRRDTLDRLGEPIITWESGGIYRVLSCGRAAHGASPVVVWLTFRYEPESDPPYVVLYRKIL